MTAATERSAWWGNDGGQVTKRLVEHGVTARTVIRKGTTAEILVDAPDGVEIQLQDVSYCGGGPLGNRCG